MKHYSYRTTKDAIINAHIDTIGRDFDEYGGDIPIAVAFGIHCDTHPSETNDRMVAIYMSKVLSSKDAAKRLTPVTIASIALYEHFGHEDWIVDALVEYSDEHCGEVAREKAAEKIGQASRQLMDCEDDPKRLEKALLAFAWKSLTGKYPQEALAA